MQNKTPLFATKMCEDNEYKDFLLDALRDNQNSATKITQFSVFETNTNAFPLNLDPILLHFVEERDAISLSEIACITAVYGVWTAEVMQLIFEKPDNSFKFLFLSLLHKNAERIDFESLSEQILKAGLIDLFSWFENDEYTYWQCLKILLDISIVFFKKCIVPPEYISEILKYIDEMLSFSKGYVLFALILQHFNDCAQFVPSLVAHFSLAYELLKTEDGIYFPCIVRFLIENDHNPHFLNVSLIKSIFKSFGNEIPNIEAFFETAKIYRLSCESEVDKWLDFQYYYSIINDLSYENATILLREILIYITEFKFCFDELEDHEKEAMIQLMKVTITKLPLIECITAIQILIAINNEEIFEFLFETIDPDDLNKSIAKNHKDEGLHAKMVEILRTLQDKYQELFGTNDE